MPPSARRSRTIAAGAVVLALASCASGPSVDSEPGAQNTRARFLLSELVKQGTVPIVTAGNPGFIGQTAAIDDFSKGVRNLIVVFDPSTDPAILDKQRVVLRWGARSDDICTAMPASGGGAAPLSAAFCDGSETVAAVIASDPATNADDEKRLMWRAANRLFPDDYEESYGLGLGVFGGSNGVGVGGGLSF